MDNKISEPIWKPKKVWPIEQKKTAKKVKKNYLEIFRNNITFARIYWPILIFVVIWIISEIIKMDIVA